MTAVVGDDTATVVTVKVPANPFGGTVTVEGTLATAGLLLDSDITPHQISANAT